MTEEQLEKAIRARGGEVLASPIIKSYLEKDNLEENLYDLAIKADNGGQPEQRSVSEHLEPVKIAHRHEWFRTGEMKVGQMRCIGCGKWGQEEAPKRKPLDKEHRYAIAEAWRNGNETASEIIDLVEAAHGIKE